jgi:hypothetical protein
LQRGWLCRRLREQARSHKGLSVLPYSHRGVVKNEAISERASAEPK